MRRFAVTLLALFFFVGATRAQDNASDFGTRRARAMERAIDWLKKAQQSDGTWNYDDKPFAIEGLKHMVSGCTALACYALLKAGVDPADATVEKGFKAFRKAPLEQTYSVGCILLAIEARYNWEPPFYEETLASGTHEKGPGPKKTQPPGGDMDLARKCVDFLVKAQRPEGSWRYGQPEGSPALRNDASHPQYALLGLDAAERLGIKVPKDVYSKAMDWFVQGQEASGPEVASFSVPGADLSFVDLKKVEKELREKIRKIDADFKGKKAGGTNAAGHTEKDERDAAGREASEKAFKTAEKQKPHVLHARGWSYQRGSGDLEDWKTRTTGSMTTSGLAALLVCKGQLDGTPGFDKQREAVDTAIRDGCAWIAANFAVDDNPNVAPNVAQHHYYYMYGLERAGMIGLVEKFGEHDWYSDGCKMFLGAQQDDGSFNARAKGTAGPVPDTCFALLFLAKGTTPIVRLPTRTATGPGSNEGK